MFRFSDEFESDLTDAAKSVGRGPVLVGLGVTTDDPIYELIEGNSITFVGFYIIAQVNFPNYLVYNST